MARMRADALDCARLIVQECLERDFRVQNDWSAENRVVATQEEFDRFRAGFQVDSTNRSNRRPARGRIADPDGYWVLAILAAVILSLALCCVAATWLENAI
jgi:hypothetical protein